MLSVKSDASPVSNLGEYVATPRVPVPTTAASMPPITTVIDAPDAPIPAVPSAPDGQMTFDDIGDSTEEIEGEVNW